MTAFQEALLSAAADGPLFAVLDGAQFASLPSQLLRGEFVSRSLYLDRGDNDPDQVVTAPHLVWLDERQEKDGGRGPDEVIPALLALMDGRPAAVFWQCRTGGEALYRHLRGINMVLYPKDQLEDFEEPEPPEVALELDPPETQAEPDTHTLVLFRHADANVMAQIAPGMEPAEKARLYGPADTMLMQPNAEWLQGDAYLDLRRPEVLPAAAPGSLRLSEATLAALRGSSETASHARTVSYLKDAVPEYTDRIPAEELEGYVTQAQTVGGTIGLQTERGIGLFAMLLVMTGGALATNHQFIEGVKADPRPADDVIDEVTEQMAQMTTEDIEGQMT